MSRATKQVDVAGLVLNLNLYRARLRATGRMVEARAVEACIRATQRAARSKGPGEGVERGEAVQTLSEAISSSLAKSATAAAGRRQTQRTKDHANH